VTELDFDHAATTPVAVEVLAAMLPYFTDVAGNPSSVHRAGQRARRAIEEARERVAASIGAAPREIVFTSGATEAINLALRGAMSLRPEGRLVSSAVEHAAVLETARDLERLGTEIELLAPDRSGCILRDQVYAAVGGGPALVALMAVNNETGVRTDIAALAPVVRERGALLFCDAVQAFGVEPLDVGELGVDLLSLSAHKVYGPKGVGALYIRSGLELRSLTTGGPQERGLRPGTHNVPAIVGFGVAAEAAAADAESEGARLVGLRSRLERGLLQVDGVSVNGGDADRGPKHSNVAVSGVDGETLLLLLDDLGVRVSAGSACAAGSVEPSHVLTAMGLDRELARASVRFSLGRSTDAPTVDAVAERFAEAVLRSRAAR
jgi:cysteine desulfurase